MTSTQHTIAVTALVEHEGRFLFIQRPATAGEYSGQWVFPGGKVDANEDVIQALLRELGEEVGLVHLTNLHFLSAYKFTRKDGSSTQGLVFLARTDTPETVIDETSASKHEWILPEEVVDYVETQRTIYGMEVHVRNALIAIRGFFIPPTAVSVTNYQEAKCNMTKQYLMDIAYGDFDVRNLSDESWIFPNKGKYAK
ncbi:MAG: NUDIX hydrolase [bacterium]|nr:NUDIX hydrolase [bacterium]